MKTAAHIVCFWLKHHRSISLCFIICFSFERMVRILTFLFTVNTFFFVVVAYRALGCCSDHYKRRWRFSISTFFFSSIQFFCRSRSLSLPFALSLPLSSVALISRLSLSLFRFCHQYSFIFRCEKKCVFEHIKFELTKNGRRLGNIAQQAKAEKLNCVGKSMRTREKKPLASKYQWANGNIKNVVGHRKRY